MAQHFTTGQVAKTLRISISTLKRWLNDTTLCIADQRNYNGWRLFSEKDIQTLREFKRQVKTQGRRFNNTTLIPVISSDVPKQ